MSTHTPTLVDRTLINHDPPKPPKPLVMLNGKPLKSALRTEASAAQRDASKLRVRIISDPTDVRIVRRWQPGRQRMYSTRKYLRKRDCGHLQATPGCRKCRKRTGVVAMQFEPDGNHHRMNGQPKFCLEQHCRIPEGEILFNHWAECDCDHVEQWYKDAIAAYLKTRAEASSFSSRREFRAALWDRIPGRSEVPVIARNKAVNHIPKTYFSIPDGTEWPVLKKGEVWHNQEDPKLYTLAHSIKCPRLTPREWVPVHGLGAPLHGGFISSKEMMFVGRRYPGLGPAKKYQFPKRNRESDEESRNRRPHKRVCTGTETGHEGRGVR